MKIQVEGMMALAEKRQAESRQGRRYSIAELINLGRKGHAFVDFNKFAPDAVNSGVLCFRNLARDMYGYPLSTWSGNRPRGQSLESDMSAGDAAVYQGTTLAMYPARQPENAPNSALAQRDEGFARFLKQHSSPTHQRVTAGGRIVPMVRPPPPAFSLAINNENYGGINPASGAFTLRANRSEDNQKSDGLEELTKRHIISGQDDVNARCHSDSSDQIAKEIYAAQANAKRDTYASRIVKADSQAKNPPPSSMANMWLQYPPYTATYIPAMTQCSETPFSASYLCQPSMFQSLLEPQTAGPGTQRRSALQVLDDGQVNSRMYEGLPMASSTFAPVTGTPLEQNDPYAYPMALPPSFGSYGQNSLPFGGNMYGPAVWPAPTPTYLSGPFAASPYLTNEHYDVLSSGIGAENTRNVQRQQGQSGPANKSQAQVAEDHFNTLTRQLEELDQFIAMHGHKVNPKVKAEKVRERIALVEKRSKARQAMQLAQSLPKYIPNMYSDMHQKVSPGSKALNVEAPPWTPVETTYSMAPQDAFQGRHMSSLIAHDSEDRDDQGLTENNDQDSLLIQTTQDVQEQSFLESSLYDDSNLMLTTMNPSSKHDEATGDVLVVAPLAEGPQGVQLSPRRQTAANYERMLDALRLPKGCITEVKIIGGAVTMVHGQGLKQPSWNEMAEHERDYWMRKPDNVFYYNSTYMDKENQPHELATADPGHATGSSPSSKQILDAGRDLSVAVPLVPKKTSQSILAPIHRNQQTARPKENSDAPALINGNVAITGGVNIPYASLRKSSDQGNKSGSSVATSAITAQVKMSQNEGGLALLQRNTGASNAASNSPKENKAPVTPKGPRGVTFFRNLWPYEDDINKKAKAESSPF